MSKIILNDEQECSVAWKDGSISTYEDFDTAIKEVLKENE